MAQDTDRSLWVCAMHAMAPVLPQCANNAESLRRVIESQLMRSGDVEENPGPNSKKLDSQVEQNERGPVPGTATPRRSPHHDAVRVDTSPRDERRNAKLPAGPRGDRGNDSWDNRRAGRNTTKQPLAKQTNMRGYLQGQTPRNPRTLRSNVTGP
ncbi:hypothetical protein ACOMHN_029475 [Nucella lapillus]